MSVVQTYQFEGPLAIGVQSFTGSSSILQKCIDDYEPTFFHATVGQDLYDILLDFAENPDDDPDISDLYAHIGWPAVAFIYCHYLQDNTFLNAGTGQMQANSNALQVVDPLASQNMAWNTHLVPSLRNFFGWIDKVKYPTFAPDWAAINELRLLNKRLWSL